MLSDFLLAKPHMKDIRFRETVIVMLYDNKEEGAAGLVLNKPLEKMFLTNLLDAVNLTPPKNMMEKEITLYWGGPVEPKHIIIIHSSDYKSKDFLLSNDHFTITRKPKVLMDIASNRGPKKYIILSGIAVWSPGQLDFEKERGDWYKKKNNYIKLFDNGIEMWSRLISSHDI